MQLLINGRGFGGLFRLELIVSDLNSIQVKSLDDRQNDRQNVVSGNPCTREPVYCRCGLFLWA